MPRPRSEEIPLEVIKKGAKAVAEASPKISILPRPQSPRVEASGSGEQRPVSVLSEETSFIARELNSTPRKKGNVETV